MDLKTNKTAGKYNIEYILSDAESVSIQFDQLKRHKDGRFGSRVKVTRQWQDKEVNLYQGSLNLMAGRSRSQLANILKERMPKDEIDFERFLEEGCRLVVEAEEETQEAEQLKIEEADTTEPEFLIWPCIPKRLPSIFFGPGGGGKTFFAMYFALLVQNGLPFMDRPVDKENVLFCDWECDRREAARRFGYLARQLQTENGQEIELPFYRKCLLPLADDVSPISIEMEKNKIGLVVIDSAAMACGGDIIAAETAVSFFNGLRKVCDPSEAASLVVSHVTKADRKDNDKKRLPIGSIFFENLSRTAWELRSQDVGDDALACGFFNRKTNFAKKGSRFGLKMDFAGDKAKVETMSAEDVESEERTTEQMILERLKTGPTKIKDLAEELDVASGTVRVTLHRAKKRGKVIALDRGLWGLSANDNEPPPGQWWDK